MAFRAATSGYAAQTVGTITLTKPTGTVSGDILIFVVTQDDTTNTFTWPSGFTEFTASPQTSTADAQRMRGAWKVAGGSEPANYTATSSVSADDFSAFLAAYSGRDTTTPINAISGNAQVGATSVASFDAAGVTTTADGCDLLWIAGSDLVSSAQAETWGMPTGYTNQVTQTSGRNWFSLTLGDKNQTTQGATGTVSGTDTFGGVGNTTGRLTFLVALAPVAAAAADAYVSMPPLAPPGGRR